MQIQSPEQSFSSLQVAPRQWLAQVHVEGAAVAVGVGFVAVEVEGEHDVDFYWG